MHTPTPIIVVRRAFTDCPDLVIELANPSTAPEDAIRRFYPSAIFDGRDGFDTEDGSFLYDRMNTTIHR
jgi:hypothetical protein